MRWRINLPDLAATERLARSLEPLTELGDMLTLQGDLGAGKTAFSRAFIQARFGMIDVPSPTFNLVLTYGEGADSIWHFDLYRLDDPDEIYELGFEEAAESAVSLIEWPERLGGLLPVERLELQFVLTKGDARHVVISASEKWAMRLTALARNERWNRDD